MTRIKRLICGETGGVALEAALIMPMFLGFALALYAMIQLSIAELALQTAVAETTKQLAANMYPVKLLYGEAKLKFAGSRAGELFQRIINAIETAKGSVGTAERFAEQYEQWIPEPLLVMVRMEKLRREQLESAASEQYEQFLDRTYRPLLNEAFTPIVWRHANDRVLRRDSFRVTRVTLPDFDRAQEAYLGIEASYEVKLPLPFVRQTFVLRKQAVERAWVGDS